MLKQFIFGYGLYMISGQTLSMFLSVVKQSGCTKLKLDGPYKAANEQCESCLNLVNNWLCRAQESTHSNTIFLL